VEQPGYDAQMKVQVFVLRRNGRKWHDRNQESIAGELRLHSVTTGSETYRVAQLCARAVRSSQAEELLPPLYSPQLIALGSESLLLRGYESSDGVGYVQEWRCVIGAKISPDPTPLDRRRT
jgi:hypothetical protein